MEDENTTTKNKLWFFRKKKNFFISVFTLLLMVFILVHQFYTYRILPPIIKESFSKLTHQKYLLKFEKVNWNIFNSSFSIHQVEILPVHKDSVFQNQQIVLQKCYLDKMKITGIAYRSSLSGNIKFKSLLLDKMKLCLALHPPVDVKQQEKKTEQMVSDFLASVQTQEILINETDICVLKEKDSLAYFKNLSIRINDLLLDSLDEKHSFYYPQFQDAYMHFDKFYLKKKNQEFIIQQLNFSTLENLKSPSIGLEKFTVQNLLSKNKTELEKLQIEMEFDHLLEGILHHKIRSSSFRISTQSVNNEINKQDSIGIEQSLKNLIKIARKLDFDLRFDTISIQIKNLYNNTPKIKNEIADAYYETYQFHLNKDTISIQNWFINLGRNRHYIEDSLDSISFNDLSYDKSSHHLIVSDLYYKNGINQSIIQWENASLVDFDLLLAVKKNQIKAKELNIKKPVINIPNEFKKRNNRKESALNLLVDISKIYIQNSNINYCGEVLDINSLDLAIDHLFYDSKNKRQWYELMRSFQVNWKELEFVPKNKKLIVLLKNTSFDSEMGRYASASTEVDWNKSDRNNRMKWQSENILLSGLNWQELLIESEVIILDTLSIDRLLIDGLIAKDTTANKNKNQKTTISIHCDYLYMPDIQASMELSVPENYIKINTKDLSVFAKYLDINTDLEELVKSNSLEFKANKTNFWQQKDSLQLVAQNWQYHMQNKTLEVNHLVVESNSNNTSYKASKQWEIAIPYVFLSGIDPMRYKINKEVSFDSIHIVNPQLFFNGNRQSEIEYQGESRSFYESFRQFVAGYSFFKINQLNISKGELQFSNQYLQHIDDVKIKQLDLNISRFYLDYTSLQNLDRFLFSDEVLFRLKGYSHIFNKGEYILNLSNVELSNIDNRLLFTNLEFLSLNKSGNLPVNIKFSSLELNEFSLLLNADKPELLIGNIYFQSPQIWQKSEWKKPKSKNQIHNLNLYPLIQEQLSGITVKHLEMNEMDLFLQGNSNARLSNMQFKGIQIQADQIKIDSNNHIFNQEKFFYSDDIRIQIPAFSYLTKDRFYSIGFKKLFFSSRSKSLLIDSVQLIPQYDKSSFSANISSQKDRIEFMIPSLSVEDMDYRDMIFRKRYSARKIKLFEPDIAIFKDKTIVFDTNVYKPMPAQMLLDLPFYLKVDTLEIENGRLQYEEKKAYMAKYGIIYFKQLNASLTGVTNDKDYREFGGALKLNAYAQLMNKSLVTLNAAYPLNSKEQEFVVMASLGEIQAEEFNPILEPLTLAMAKSGNFLNMQMMAHGNKEVATGEMLLKYKDLKIEVLRKKNLQESVFISFLANSMIKKNNNSYFRLRKGPIYFERNKHRGFFHYLTHLAIMGAKTSVGVEVKKTKKKIKNLNKE